MIQEFKYDNDDYGPARSVKTDGGVLPASFLLRRDGESDAAWADRLKPFGVIIVLRHPFEGDINTQDHGEPQVEVDEYGWEHISYPNPVGKVPCWSTATREVMYVSEGADIPAGYTDQPPAHALFAFWSGSEWDEDVSAAKSVKLAEIRDEAQAFLDAVAQAEYPAWEIETWKDQEAEATAWDEDNATPTPNIDIIAENRGMDRLVLIPRILKNVADWKPLAHAIVGQRLKFKDALDAAETLADVEGIEVAYVVPA